MPLDITPSLKTHLEGPLTTLATCTYVKLVDGSGVSIFFTDHDKSIYYGGDKYESVAGYDPSAQQSRIDLSVDNMTLTGIIDGVHVKLEDLLAGRWNHADVRNFIVNYKNPDGDGDLVLINGKIGKIDIIGNTFRAELRSLGQFFQLSVGTPYTVLCSTKFGRVATRYGCNVVIDPEVWRPSTSYQIGSVVKANTYDERRYAATSIVGSGLSGLSEPLWDTTIGNTTVDNEVTWTAQDALLKLFTVTSVDPSSPNRVFGTTLTDSNNHFDLGLVRWNVSDNQFFKMDVKVYLNSFGQIELYEPMPFEIKVGDAGSIQTGCDKTWDTCRTRYNNGLNFQGYPYLTGISPIIRGN